MNRPLAALAAVIASAASAPAQLYLIGMNAGNTAAQFGSVNFDPLNPTAAKTYTSINANIVNTEPSSSSISRALTANGAGGFYFMIDQGRDLRSISTAGVVNGTIDRGEPSNSLSGLARSTGGTVFGYNFTVDDLVTVNTTTGAFTTVGDSGVSESNQRGMLAFAGSTLYATLGAGNGTLRTVNTTTGTFGAAIGSANATYTQMSAFGVGNSLYGVSGGRLYQVDLVTTPGALIDLGAVGGSLPANGFYGAYYVAPVPEPASALGVAAAGLGLAGWVRRRRGRVLTTGEVADIA